MISHRFRTVFVHVPKTGGQSVERVFLQAHGLDWPDRAALLLRRNGKPARGPERLAHLYAREYPALGHLDDRTFSNFFKFAIVRDPYERIVSEFNYREHDCLTVEDFVLRVGDDGYSDLARHVVPQVNYVLDGDGRQMVDRLVRFERLASDMPEVFQITLGAAQPLPVSNVTAARKLTTDALTEADVGFINAFYAADFERFGYPMR